MKSERTPRKGRWKQLSALVAFLLLGVACGLAIGRVADALFSGARSPAQIILTMIGLLLFFYLTIFLHIIFHEAGHMIFGLLTGYHFSSFRVGSVILLRENGRFVLRRYSLAGTGGQCLMAPPDFVDGRIPYLLYNLGGSIVGALLALLALLLRALLPCGPIADAMLLIFAMVGIAFALLNGLPLPTGPISNDGTNAKNIHASHDAMRAFWLQMKISELTARGVRLKDMPAEWFEFSPQESMQNSMTTAIRVFACSRKMDEMDFAAADRMMADLLNAGGTLLGLYRSLLTAERLYCELVGENRAEIVTRSYDRPMQKFLRSMRTNPSVQRILYAYALLYERDERAAQNALDHFEKIAKKYPYQQEIEAERELIAFAKGRVQNS